MSTSEATLNQVATWVIGNTLEVLKQNRHEPKLNSIIHKVTAITKKSPTILSIEKKGERPKDFIIKETFSDLYEINREIELTDYLKRVLIQCEKPYNHLAGWEVQDLTAFKRITNRIPDFFHEMFESIGVMEVEPIGLEEVKVYTYHELSEEEKILLDRTLSACIKETHINEALVNGLFMNHKKKDLDSFSDEIKKRFKNFDTHMAYYIYRIPEGDNFYFTKLKMENNLPETLDFSYLIDLT